MREEASSRTDTGLDCNPPSVLSEYFTSVSLFDFTTAGQAWLCSGDILATVLYISTKELATVISVSQVNFVLQSQNKLFLQFGQHIDILETVGKSVKFTYDLIFPVFLMKMSQY